jgi:hypothetical protein
MNCENVFLSVTWNHQFTHIMVNDLEGYQVKQRRCCRLKKQRNFLIQFIHVTINLGCLHWRMGVCMFQRSWRFGIDAAQSLRWKLFLIWVSWIKRGVYVSLLILAFYFNHMVDISSSHSHIRISFLTWYIPIYIYTRIFINFYIIYSYINEFSF